MMVVVWKILLWSKIPTWNSWSSKFEDTALFSICLTAINGVRSSEFVNMEKICHRYVIQYLHLKGFRSTNLKVELYSTLCESHHTWGERTIKQWTKSRESAPTKKTVPFGGKVIVSAFWDACEIILIFKKVKQSTASITRTYCKI